MSSKSPNTFPFQVFDAGLGTSMSGMMKANVEAGQAWIENCSAVGRELAAFATRRWTEDADAFCRLCGCTSPLQAFEIQVESAQRAINQYMEETARLADMATKAGTSCIGTIDRGVRSAMATPGDGARKAA